MRIGNEQYNLGVLIKDKGMPFFQKHIMGDLMESRDNKPAILTPHHFSIKEIHESVDVKDFPVITGMLIEKQVMQSYDNVAKIGDELVTVMPSDKLVDRLPGLDHKSKTEQVDPGMPYPHTAQITERYVEFRAVKFGQILDITWEAVKFDQTGQILAEAAKIGEDAAFEKEKDIIKTFQDLANYKAWFPNGVQVDMYQVAGAAPHEFGNLITNALVDWTDLDAAMQCFVAMRDLNGNPLNIQPKVLVVPSKLLNKSRMILGPEYLSGTDQNIPNPVKNLAKIISSPFFDMVSEREWYLGDPKRQMVWKEILPLQVQRRGTETEAGWNRDIYAQFKVRYMGKAASKDYKTVIKSTGTV